MSTSTSNYTFTLPAVNDPTDADLWGTENNANWSSIDALLKTATDTIHLNLSGDTTMDNTSRNKIVLCDATAASFTCTLQNPVTAGDGFTRTFKKTDASAHTVTIQKFNTDTIDGNNTLVLSNKNDSATLVCDGTNWFIEGATAAAISASTTTKGVVQLTTTADVQAGSSATLAVTPAALSGALGFKTFYESAQTAFVLGTANSFTHGLGGLPKFCMCELVNQTAEFGYSIGDRISTQMHVGTGAGTGLGLSYSTTTIYFSPSALIQIPNRATGATDNLTAANWKVVVRAWA